MLSSSSSSSSSSSLPSTSGSKRPKPDPVAKKGPAAHSKWKTPGQQLIYNRRLLDALRSQQPPAASARSVKEAADSALALTAHGQSRWSRAILSGRHLPRRRRVLLKAASASRRRGPPKTKTAQLEEEEEEHPTKDAKVNERLRRLGRLVPGCRKLAAPRMLEEAADYVAALEMQVRSMRMLVESMSTAALSPTTEGGPPADSS